MTIPILFSSVFVAIGIALLGWGVISARRSIAVAAWPIAPGQITKCELKESSDSDGTTCVVKVEYSYRIGGKSYTGSRIAYGYSGSSATGTHQQLFNQLNTCRGVVVHYNPTDPTTSALSYGVHRSIVFILIFGSVWLTFSIGMMLLFWTGISGGDVLLKNIVVHH